MNVRNIERYDFYLDSQGRYVVKTTLGKEIRFKPEKEGKMRECKHRVFYADDLGEVFKKIEERRKEDLVSIDGGGEVTDEEYVRYYFESQRPMTKKEKYEYWRAQREQYWSKFVPMLPVVDVGKTLEWMITKEKSGNKLGGINEG